MSELKYKFIICSDVHSSVSVTDVGVLKSYKDSLRNGVAAVLCCGDIMEPYYGVSPTDRTGAAYTNGRAMIGEMAKLGGIMCAGNHSSSYGYGTYNGQSGVEAWNTLYDESRLSNDGVNYVDRYTRIKYIGTDVFIAVSDMTGNADYPASTVETVRAAIEEAKADNRRIFVLTHYPYCCLSDGSTRGQKNSNIESNAFAARLTNATDNGTLRTQANYPDPRGNALLEMLAHTDGLIWFSGHNHNFWQISHDGGLVLYSQTAYAQSGAAANTNYLLEYPYAHVLHLDGGAFMFNLPSLKHNLQDAIVYVYDDHVEVRERQCTKGSTISSGAAAGEVTGGNVKGAYKTTAWTVSDLDDGGSVKFEELSGGTHSIPLIASSIPAPGTPTTYTATFVADCVTVGTVPFRDGVLLGTVPSVPAKTGYTGTWEEYTLGNADITINAVYTAVEPEPPEEPDEPDEGATLWGIGADGQPVRYDGIKLLYGIDGAEARNKVYDISGGELLL